MTQGKDRPIATSSLCDLHTHFCFYRSTAQHSTLVGGYFAGPGSVGMHATSASKLQLQKKTREVRGLQAVGAGGSQAGPSLLCSFHFFRGSHR